MSGTSYSVVTMMDRLPSNTRSLSCIKDFRNNVVTSLVTANIAGIGSNVTSSRMENAWPEEEGFACVYLPTVTFDDKRTSPRFYSAVGELYVDVYARAFINGDTALTGRDSMKDVNDFLDDTAKAIVEALQPIEKREGPYNGLVKRFVLKSMNNNLSEKGESERGSVRIAWNVEFAACVTYGAPKDDFIKAETTLTMGGNAKNRMDFETVVQTPPPAPPEPEPDEPDSGTDENDNDLENSET